MVAGLQIRMTYFSLIIFKLLHCCMGQDHSTCIFFLRFPVFLKFGISFMCCFDSVFIEHSLSPRVILRIKSGWRQEVKGREKLRKNISTGFLRILTTYGLEQKSKKIPCQDVGTSAWFQAARKEAAERKPVET